MPEDESFQAARAMRRAILGHAYVEAQVAGANTTSVEFQDFVTSLAWGTWARGGPLSARDRSLLVLVMTAAPGTHG